MRGRDPEDITRMLQDNDMRGAGLHRERDAEAGPASDEWTLSGYIYEKYGLYDVCVPSQTQGVQWYGGSPSHRSCVASAFHAPRRCASATSW